jgi:tripartite-type tricarboxylate transporter receptor subunit TctC
MRQLIAAACTLLALGAQAQSDYPNRPVTMIVPFPPGGVADITARPVAEAMGRHLQQPVVVENKAGAGGGVGMQYVSRAKPDGYTVLLALSSISIIPEADKVLGRDPMFQLSQLVPIARFTADPTVLAVRADAPWKSAKEFLDAAKQAPGSIPYGSSGNYGTMHVPMEMLNASAGTKMLHVPFTGAGPAVVALLGGQVQALSTGPSSIMGHYKGGKVRVLASWGESRHPALPDVPTLKELGYNVEYYLWVGLFAPKGTPPQIVATLRSAIDKAAHSDQFTAALSNLGLDLAYLDGPDFGTFWDADIKRVGEAVRAIGRVQG